MSHDACTSGTSRVLTVAPLQLLKMEALIPAHADCEVWSVIEVLKSQSIALNEIHRQLCQVYGHTRLDCQHLSNRGLAGKCLFTIHSIARTSHPVISIFSYTSRNSCLVGVSGGGDECDSGSNPRRQTSKTNVSIPEVNMLKNSSTSITLGLFL